ncbi:MAG: asparagine synthase C-terminal domain-containing protein [Thermoplasmata archaeon]
MNEASESERTQRKVLLDRTLASQLDQVLLESAVRALAGTPEIGVLFSGGLDSSFLAAFLSRKWQVTLESIGVAGSPDALAAREGAELLGLPWLSHEIGGDDLRRIRLRFHHEFDGLREPRRGVAVAFALALELASKPILVCGQGADELFFGYAHYRGLSIPSRLRRRAEDLERLEHDDWPLAQRLAGACGRRVVAPFLDPQFVRLILQLPEGVAAEGLETKPLLRAWARERGLSATLAGRPKRALQYGSGISKLLEQEDRRQPK